MVDLLLNTEKIQFLELPDEMIEHISSYLSFLGARNLCNCCRRLRDLLTPLLLSNYPLSYLHYHYYMKNRYNIRKRYNIPLNYVNTAYKFGQDYILVRSTFDGIEVFHYNPITNEIKELSQEDRIYSNLYSLDQNTIVALSEEHKSLYFFQAKDEGIIRKQTPSIPCYDLLIADAEILINNLYENQLHWYDQETNEIRKTWYSKLIYYDVGSFQYDGSIFTGLNGRSDPLLLDPRVKEVIYRSRDTSLHSFLRLHPDCIKAKEQGLYIFLCPQGKNETFCFNYDFRADKWRKLAFTLSYSVTNSISCEPFLVEGRYVYMVTRLLKDNLIDQGVSSLYCIDLQEERIIKKFPKQFNTILYFDYLNKEMIVRENNYEHNISLCVED